jgi:hypothetical protein
VFSSAEAIKLWLDGPTMAKLSNLDGRVTFPGHLLGRHERARPPTSGSKNDWVMVM